MSYICITHVEGIGFNVYLSKGHPSHETIELMSVLERMEEHIKSLCSKMNYKDGTEIVLILLFASDKMIHVVNLFPKVFFMDDTCSTNCQN